MIKNTNRALPVGSILNRKYVIAQGIGEGGFGITYVARDSILDTRVAIKEYYPMGMAFRNVDTGGTRIEIIPGMEEQFELGLQRYVNEAKILSELFNLPGIVCVKDFFYENNTAYIVMEYIDGISLKEYLRQNGDRLSTPQTLAVMDCILSSLSIVHKHGLLHRDISPDNIMISRDGDVKLIDFGAARNFEQNMEQSMTVMLKHGYAPIEQYSRNGQQDKYTDVYSICATMYRMLTGVVPDDAVDRLNGKKLLPIRKHKKVRVPRYIQNAILKGLSVSARERHQSVEELYTELYISKEERRRHQLFRMKNAFVLGLVGICMTVCITATVVLIKYQSVNDEKDAVTESVEKEEELATVEKNRFEKFSTDNSKKADTDSETKNTTNEQNYSDEVDEDRSSTDKDEETERQQEIEESPLANVESHNTYAVSVVSHGVLNSYSQEYTLGEIFESYYEDGVWQEQQDSYGNTYVNYIGLKDGDIYALRFQVYEDDTFVVSDIARNGENVADVNGYIANIFEQLDIQ